MSVESPDPPSSLVPPKTPTQRVILHHVWRRMNIKNEHFMGAIVGREGKAKSHTALKIASGVDPTFTADRVFFNAAHALAAITGDEHGAGDMIVIDEAGVSMGNRTWYDRDQIEINQALQTVRSKNMGVLWTLPRLSELDRQTHGRLHAYIEMTRKYPEKDQPYAVGKWKNIDPTRDERDKLYKEYPRMRSSGYKKKIKEIAFTPPPEELVAAYEPRKDDFVDQFAEDAVERAQEELEAEEMQPQEIAEAADSEDLAAVVRAHGRTGDPIVDKDLARSHWDVSHADARAVKSLLEQQYDQSDLAEFI